MKKNYKKLQLNEQKEDVSIEDRQQKVYLKSRNGRLGYKHSEETKQKMSKAQTGKVVSSITKEKISKTKIGKKIKPMSAESRKNISLSKIGDKNPAWKGGKTPLLVKIRNSREMTEWKNSIFERDQYTCQECGAKNGEGRRIILNAEHIKPFSVIIDEYEIDTFEKALECHELWDIKNGKTLCIDCHKKVGLFGGNVISTYYAQEQYDEIRQTNWILMVNTIFTIVTGIGIIILSLLEYFKK